MDPNVNLAEQLRIALHLAECERPDDAPSEECAGVHDAARLAELVLALDEWIQKGGSAPDRWLQAI